MQGVLQQRPKRERESTLGFCEETTIKEVKEGGWGYCFRARSPIERHWRGSQRPREKEEAGTPGKRSVGRVVRGKRDKRRAWRPRVRGLLGRAADCGAGKWEAPDSKAIF